MTLSLSDALNTFSPRLFEWHGLCLLVISEGLRKGLMKAKGGVELRTGVVEKNAGGAGYHWPRSGFLPLLSMQW